jgi:hypothetical protein
VPGLVAGQLANTLPPDQIANGYGGLVLIAAIIAMIALRRSSRERA